MKISILLIVLAMFSMNSFTAKAQVKVDVEKKVSREANQRANRKTDKIIDKGFDSLEKGIDGLFKKKEKEKSQAQQQDDTTSDKPGENATTEEPANEIQETQPQLEWAKYDFVPGPEIIFEDNQEGEQNGEFPSKWDLKAGVVENAFFDGNNVIFFRETGNPPNGIVPLISNSKEDYLPDEFTVEFDAYYAANKFNQYFSVLFYDAKNQKNNQMKRLVLDINSVDYGSEIKKQYPNTERSNTDKTAKWRHIAISFNKRALKVYMDDTRMINIPNVTENPSGITIGAYLHKEGAFYIKNVRIAKGAVPLYDKFLTDGKFVTTGIKFDVNKATLKPESMGTINYVVKMMQEHPELKFSVEGHTDSDGDEAMNQNLSEARSKTVMEQMISLGISADRLKSAGWGESKPISDNSTAEGKANNRRVEFVKF
ncbi:MAG: OmpA family protein [Draconibacterium sp.]